MKASKTISGARDKWTRWLVRAALASLGVLAVVWLVKEAGASEVTDALRVASPWLPVVFGLEGVRIGLEVWATRSVLQSLGATVPRAELWRTHLVHYAVCMSMPAGRAAAEATKAAMIAPHTGVGRAAATGTVGQALNLAANGAVSIPCAYAAWSLTGNSALTWALAVQAVVCVGLGLGLQLLARWPFAAAWIRRFPRVARSVDAFREACQEIPLLPRVPFGLMFAGRLVQVLEFGVVAMAVGLGFGIDTAFLGQGVNLLSTTLGDFVPGQLGVMEGAFRVSASAFGATLARAVSIAVLIHVVQLAWVTVGAFVPIFWRPVAPVRDPQALRTVARTTDGAGPTRTGPPDTPAR